MEELTGGETCGAGSGHLVALTGGEVQQLPSREGMAILELHAHMRGQPRPL